MAKPNLPDSLKVMENTSAEQVLRIPLDKIIIKLKEGTMRTVRVSWVDGWTVVKSATTGLYTTVNYQIVWRWHNPDINAWVSGSGDESNPDETEGYLDKYWDITAPDEANAISVSVKPVSRTYPVDEDTNLPYYKADWSGYKDFKFDAKPQTPPKPTVEVSGDKIKMTVSDINLNGDDLYSKTHDIRFELTRVEPNDHTVMIPNSHEYSPYWIAMTSTSKTSSQTPSKKGEYYRVRCIARFVPDSTKDFAVESEWSEYSEVVLMPPDNPKIEDISPLSDKDVRIKWQKINGADKYIIQYIHKDSIPKDMVVVEDVNNMPKDDYQYKYISLTELFTYTSINKSEVTVEMISGDDKDYATYVLQNIASGEYYIRIFSSNKSGQSTGSETEKRSLKSFIIGTAPTAPTTWSNSNTAVKGEPIELYWIHNSEDNSILKRSKLEISYNGIAKQFDIDSNAFSDTIADNIPITAIAYDYEKETTRHCTIDTTNVESGMTIKWRVWTAGAAVNKDGTPKYSEDPSIERTIEVYDKPTLNVNLVDLITGVVSDITGFPFMINASVTHVNNQKPMSYHISLVPNRSYETMDDTGNVIVIPANTPVYSKYIDTNVTTMKNVTVSNNGFDVSVVVDAGDCDLIKGVGYTVQATVSMDSGLSSDFSNGYYYVEWADEVTLIPGGNVTVDKENVTANISIVATDATGTPVFDNSYEFAVYRREIDGTFVLIEDGLEYNSVAIDKYPALDYARYRVVARSKRTGRMTYQDLNSVYIGEYGIIIRYADVLLRLIYNIKVNDTFGTEGSLVNYIGREYPVSYYGTHKSHTSSWTTEIPKTDIDTLNAIRRLAVWMGNVYVREPYGTGYWANISVSYGHDYSSLTIPISFSITRVEGDK